MTSDADKSATQRWWLNPSLARLAFGSSTRDARHPPESARSAMRNALLHGAGGLDLDDPEQREFGDYDLLELVGQGGMGLVYRARQRELDRDVAIKLLSAGQDASEEFVESFRHEAQNAALLQHPNIVIVHEMGEHAGLVFYSMQLVRGRSLSQRLDQDGTLPPREAAELLRTVAEAVDYAHRLGVLHLDLKPGNILLDAQGEPMVSDFGLARRLEQALDNERVSGTPSYMAPEQAQLKGPALSCATDVWALGAMLYEMLTGQPPFEGGDAATTVRHLLELKVRSPARYVDVPPDLEAICMQCLAKDPGQRYSSARELAEDLGNFLAGRPVHARPLNLAQRTAHFARREPRLALGAMLLIAGLGTGLGVTSVLWKEAQTNATRALEANRFLNEDVLGSVDPYQFQPTGGSPAQLTVTALLARAETRLEQGKVSHPEVRTKIGLTIGRAYFGLGLWKQANNRLTHTYAYAKTSLGEFAPLTLDVEQQLALTKIFGSQYDDARIIYRHLLQARRKYSGWSRPSTISARRGHVQLLYELGFIQQALLELEDTRKDAVLNSPKQLAAIDWKLSDLYAESNRWEEAEKLVRSSLEVSLRNLGPSHPQYLWESVSLGDVLLMRGKWNEADLLFRNLHAEFTASLGAHHPMTLTISHYLGQLSLERGDLDSALPQLEQTLELRKQVHGESHKWTQYTVNRLGQALIAANRPAEAIPMLERALALATRAGRRKQSYVLLILDNLARAEIRNNNPKRARQYLDEALATAMERLPPNNYRIGLLNRTLGELYESNGNLRQARIAYGTAERIFNEGFGADHPKVKVLRAKLRELEASGISASASIVSKFN